MNVFIYKVKSVDSGEKPHVSRNSSLVLDHRSLSAGLAGSAGVVWSDWHPRQHLASPRRAGGHDRQGQERFRARQAGAQCMQHSEIGWVEAFPRDASIESGTVVAVLIRHLGFWSLNGCRVLYHLDGGDTRFGFAYGTLTNHAEAGEELFALELDPATETVTYRIRAISWPRAVLARIGQ